MGTRSPVDPATMCHIGNRRWPGQSSMCRIPKYGIKSINTWKIRIQNPKITYLLTHFPLVHQIVHSLSISCISYSRTQLLVKDSYYRAIAVKWWRKIYN